MNSSLEKGTIEQWQNNNKYLSDTPHLSTMFHPAPVTAGIWASLAIAPGGFLSTTPGTLASPFPRTACKGSPQPHAALGHTAAALQHHFSLSLEQNNKTATIKGKIKIPSLQKEKDGFIILKVKHLFSFYFKRFLHFLLPKPWVY